MNPRNVFVVAWALIAATSVRAQDPAREAMARLHVVGDGIPGPLSRSAGDAERGHALMVERAAANCLLCHAVPGAAIAGNVGPTLAGVANRLSAAQLRLRIADIQLVKPDAAMPSYYRIERLDRVAGEYRGKPVLEAREVEDLVAYLGTLK
ncbi:MAG TPA: sulfur oxidation c-type cytochrome SoxX [Casimicrobiaceae bacterium]|nr:sulfur oxidation c-type cytochrome SoxX [Casimicrobiaceae bacterium]